MRRDALGSRGALHGPLLQIVFRMPLKIFAGFSGRRGIILVTNRTIMKIKPFTALAFSVSILVGSINAFAADTNAPAPAKKLVPDKMTTCPVSGDKLGEMGKPFVFEYKGQEVKLCCKSCKKDFEKNPEKYMKKIREADKAPAKKEKDAPAKKDDKN